jgi:WD40 repeat protein
MASQRLAVGTGEGTIVMYDLKTATRLYVLECHRPGLDACSFSPDGRRLVTVSLEEGAVFVWKLAVASRVSSILELRRARGTGDQNRSSPSTSTLAKQVSFLIPLHYY